MPRTTRKPAGAAGQSSTPARLLATVRRDLRAVADSQRAEGMQRYMRSQMPFHGVMAPGVARIARERFGAMGFDSADSWRRTVLYLWRRAKFREERYSAIALSGVRAAAEFQTTASLPMYEEMIVTGAWWDYVDEIAIRRVGPILRRFPAQVAPLMRRWSHSGDLWKRRTSIICQVGSKDATDSSLLFACIEPSLESREFFLRKGIGWALRQHARARPDEVRRYVASHGDRLSNLSRREALRHLGGEDSPPASKGD